MRFGRASHPVAQQSRSRVPGSENGKRARWIRVHVLASTANPEPPPRAAAHACTTLSGLYISNDYDALYLQRILGSVMWYTAASSPGLGSSPCCLMTIDGEDKTIRAGTGMASHLQLLTKKCFGQS
jgi:hypothetical protein